VLLLAAKSVVFASAWQIPAQLPGALVGLMNVGSSSGALKALRRDARTCTKARQRVDCRGVSMSSLSPRSGALQQCVANGCVLTMLRCSACAAPSAPPSTECRLSAGAAAGRVPMPPRPVALAWMLNAGS
jgi:hypothetical protein